MFNRVLAKERARNIMSRDLSACVGAYMLHLLLCFAPFAAPAASIGLWRYNLDVVRGGKPRASKVLRGYDTFSRALALQMWNALFLFLWSLPTTVLIFVGSMISGVSLTSFNIFSSSGRLAFGTTLVISLIFYLLAMLWSLFVTIHKSAQYLFSFAILADRPEYTAKQCLDNSVQLSTPYIGHIIIAMLSFIGWNILSLLTSGIAGMLYIYPYTNLTWAEIYCQIVPREQWGSAGGGEVVAPPPPPQLPVQRPADPSGTIRGVSGYYTGYEFQLRDGESINIGRDSKIAQIVFADSEDGKNISRLHCTISFSAMRNGYTVTDKSSNGTYRSDGSQLPPNTPVEIPRNTTVYFGSPNNSFRLD